MYYPAQEVAFCAHGFTPLLPLTVCSASSQAGTALYEPYIAGNFTQVSNPLHYSTVLYEPCGLHKPCTLHTGKPSVLYEPYIAGNFTRVSNLHCTDRTHEIVQTMHGPQLHSGEQSAGTTLYVYEPLYCTNRVLYKGRLYHANRAWPATSFR